MDQFSSADRVRGQEGVEVVDTVGDTEVGKEGRLNGGEDEHGTVGTTTTKMRLRSDEMDM